MKRNARVIYSCPNPTQHGAPMALASALRRDFEHVQLRNDPLAVLVLCLRLRLRLCLDTSWKCCLLARDASELS